MDDIYSAFGGVFGDIFNQSTSSKDKINDIKNDEDYLNELWEDYNDLINKLKVDGYKVLRNDKGDHKIIRND